MQTFSPLEQIIISYFTYVIKVLVLFLETLLAFFVAFFSLLTEKNQVINLFKNLALQEENICKIEVIELG